MGCSEDSVIMPIRWWALTSTQEAPHSWSVLLASLYCLFLGVVVGRRAGIPHALLSAGAPIQAEAEALAQLSCSANSVETSQAHSCG